MQEPPEVSVTKRAHLVTFLGALLVCLAVVLWMIGPYLLALFLGGTLAMLAYPSYLWLRARSWGPRSSATAVTFLMLLLVIAPLTGFSILAVRQGIAIGGELAELQEFSPKAITVALSRWQLVRMVIGDPGLVNARLKSTLQAAGQFTSAAVLTLGAGVPAFLLQLTLTLIAFFYFLLDGENVQAKLVEAFRDTMVSAVLAGLADASSLAAMISAGFLLLDVPGAFLAGGMTFIFAWIPVLGTLPALFAGSLYLYMQGSHIRLALMIVLALATSAVDHMVRPLVLKGRTGLHPLVGLVAIFSGIQMFGILGVFIGPILAAMLLALLRIWPSIGYRFGIDRRQTDDAERAEFDSTAKS
jgi:predicted PurR-regulated permease PerM